MFSTIVLMTFAGVHNTVIVTLGLLCFLCFILARRKQHLYEMLLCLLMFVVVYALNNSGTMRQFHIVSDNA